MIGEKLPRQTRPRYRIDHAMRRFVFFFFLAFSLIAQDRIGSVQVRVSTDRADWRYELGQPVRFRISVIQDGHALTGVKVSYRIGPEMIPPKVDETATISADGITVDGGTMKEPGFLRCIATIEQNGRTYRGLATAAFQPGSHQTHTGRPGRLRSILGSRQRGSRETAH